MVLQSNPVVHDPYKTGPLWLVFVHGFLDEGNCWHVTVNALTGVPLLHFCSHRLAGNRVAKNRIRVLGFITPESSCPG